MHGVLRRLALTLAKSGLNVLRFDYFGVGNSGGESDEIDLDGWRRDIEMAIDELKSWASDWAPRWRPLSPKREMM